MYSGKNLFRMSAAAVFSMLISLPSQPSAAGDKEGCHVPDGFDALLMKSQPVIMLGEIHGTMEVADFTYDLICSYLKAGKSVTLELEYSASNQSAIDAFIAGGVVDRNLLFTDEWRGGFQFGLHSDAMAQLIERMAHLMAEGAALKVLAVGDYSNVGSAIGAGPANFIRNNILSKTDIGIFLLGRMHTMWSEPGYEASFFKRDEVLSLQISHDAGQAWVCYGASKDSCGIKNRPALNQISPSAVSKWRIKLDEDVSGPDDGLFYVGPIQASPPAIMAGSIQ